MKIYNNDSNRLCLFWLQRQFIYQRENFLEEVKFNLLLRQYRNLDLHTFNFLINAIELTIFLN